MACKICEKKPIWEFTNQMRLCQKCFVDYFERKVFRTIRKYGILPDKIMLNKSQNINTPVLKSVLQKKFPVKFGKANLSSKNLSGFAEEIFSKVASGKFKFKIEKTPLMFLSDKEVELYAKIKKIKGKKIKRNEKIQELFEKFIKKNPDLEHNIINAYFQLN